MGAPKSMPCSKGVHLTFGEDLGLGKESAQVGVFLDFEKRVPRRGSLEACHTWMECA